MDIFNCRDDNSKKRRKDRSGETHIRVENTRTWALVMVHSSNSYVENTNLVQKERVENVVGPNHEHLVTTLQGLGLWAEGMSEDTGNSAYI